MKKLIIFFSVAVLVTEMGCKKDYLDINTNPNSASNTTPELVMPAAIARTASRQITAYPFISGWMGYWSISGSYALSNNDFTTYQQTTQFGNAPYTNGIYGLWNPIFDNLEDYDYVEQQGRILGDGFYEAAAKIMKAYEYQQLVDMFGDVPYTDALKGTSVILPTYTNGQSIYDSLILNLDAAVTLMENSPVVLRTGDILFQGTNTKWVQFANTLKLRILLRQSEIGRDSYITGEIAKISADGNGFITTDVAANPGYLNADGKQNPFWDFNYNATGTYTNDFWRANQYMIDFSKANGDSRYAYVYAPTPTSKTQHEADSAKHVTDTTVFVRPLSWIGNYTGQSVGAIVGSATSVFGSGVLKSFSQPAIILSASESYFLQAEAAIRGWITADPKASYESGVRASFTYLQAKTLSVKSVRTGLDSITYTLDQSIVNYLAQPNNKNTNFDATTNFDEQLALIITQKWLALNTVTPFESWADYRRLGLPAEIPLSQSPYVDMAAIPVRIKYPEIEYLTNAANVPAQADLAHHTDKLFWMP